MGLTSRGDDGCASALVVSSTALGCRRPGSSAGPGRPPLMDDRAPPQARRRRRRGAVILQQRLTAAGLDTSVEIPLAAHGIPRHRSGGPRLPAAARPPPVGHLRRTDLDGAQLVEAGWRPRVTRLLYLHQPMLRGDDVGRAQGGPSARSASTPAGWTASSDRRPNGPSVRLPAQRRTDHRRGLRKRHHPDQGSSTSVDHPDALDQRRRGPPSTETLRSQPPVIAGRRIVVGEARRGLDVHWPAMPSTGSCRMPRLPSSPVLHHPHPSVTRRSRPTTSAPTAASTSGFKALHRRSRPRSAYYCTTGFESAGGRQLATLLVDELVTMLPSS